MTSFLVAALIVYATSSTLANKQNKCGCVDQNGCEKKTADKLDCPLSRSLCTAALFEDFARSLLDEAVAKYPTTCNKGWSTVSIKGTEYGCPNPMVALVQNDLMDGNVHTMYIDGFNGKAPARFIFKSSDNSGNVPLFMMMYLWENFITINEKKDGKWCSDVSAVQNRVNWNFWYMSLKFQTPKDGNQRIDFSFFDNKYDTFYRYYPQTPIKKGDWFIFDEDFYYILGISWSRIRHVQFKQNPIPGSRIVIHGLFNEGGRYNININDRKGDTKMRIWGMVDRELIDQNAIYGYGRNQKCRCGAFSVDQKFVIIIEVLEKGIKFYGNGWLLCTFEHEQFKLSDISQIVFNGVSDVGYGATTCDYYLY